MSAITVEDTKCPELSLKMDYPSFIVVRGMIHFYQGGFRGILEPEKVLSYKKHGWFAYAFAKDDWGVIEHIPRYTSGTKRPILIPPQKRIHVHRGLWRLEDTSGYSYDSHRRFFDDAYIAETLERQKKGGRHIQRH